MSAGRDPDRDLNADLALVQPRMERLLGIAERSDAEKAALSKTLAPDVALAVDYVRRGDLVRAATVFETIAERYRAGCFIGDAESYAQRAKDARAAHRLKQRNAKKGTAKR